MAQVVEEKPSRLRRAYNKLTGKEETRKQTAWGRMHLEGSFIPLQNMGDTEARTLELKSVTNDMQEDYRKTYETKKGNLRKPSVRQEKAYKKRCNLRVFNLFFRIGSQWYRGLDDRELAKKVKAYLELWNYMGDLEAFTDDLYMCSMQLINLSWKSLDVTQTPLYLIESQTKYVVTPEDTRIKSLDFEKEAKDY